MPDERDRTGRVAIYDWTRPELAAGRPTLGLRDEARKNAEEASQARNIAVRWGRFYGAVQLILGSATVVAGALAAAFATDKNASSARILAVVAAVIAALNTFLNAGKRSADKWALAAGLLGVSKRFRALALAAKEPTSREFEVLVEHWEKVETPPRT